jgi:hypothetical protein
MVHRDDGSMAQFYMMIPFFFSVDEARSLLQLVMPDGMQLWDTLPTHILEGKGANGAMVRPKFASPTILLPCFRLHWQAGQIQDNQGQVEQDT